MPDIQRYRMVEKCGPSGNVYVEVEESALGDWVKAGPAFAALAEKDAEIADLRERLEWQGAVTKALLPYQDELVALRSRIEKLADRVDKLGETLTESHILPRTALEIRFLLTPEEEQ